jgi:hypothetical protein
MQLLRQRGDAQGPVVQIKYLVPGLEAPSRPEAAARLGDETPAPLWPALKWRSEPIAIRPYCHHFTCCPSLGGREFRRAASSAVRSRWPGRQASSQAQRVETWPRASSVAPKFTPEAATHTIVLDAGNTHCRTPADGTLSNLISKSQFRPGYASKMRWR